MLAWIVIVLGLVITASIVVSFTPKPDGVDLRGMFLLLFLIPIGFSVFFLSSLESLVTGAAVFIMGVYSICQPQFMAKSYYAWPADKGFFSYIGYVLQPLFNTGIIWELILFVIAAYWLGLLSEKIKTQASISSKADESVFQAEQEKVRCVYLQNKYDEDVNRLSSLIIVLSDLAKDIPSVLEVKNLFGLVLDKTAKLFSAANCAIFSVDNAANSLTHVCSTGYDHAMLEGLKLTADAGSGLPGWCAKNAKFLSLKGIEKDAYMADVLAQNKFPVDFCQPITDKGKSIAVICVGGIEKEFPEKEFMRLALILANISAIALQNARLMENTKELALRDGLTGLYNHRYFYELLEEMMKKSRRDALALGVFLIDIDFFKKFNDVYGHQLGDVILQETARIIQSQIEKSDIAARYGGEEFAVVCARKDAQAINKIAEDTRRAVETAAFQHNSLKLSVTISAGVAFYGLDTGLTASELVKHSDEALYKAKESGRNKVCFYGG